MVQHIPWDSGIWQEMKMKVKNTSTSGNLDFWIGTALRLSHLMAGNSQD
jgi:hypothetical protein